MQRPDTPIKDDLQNHAAYFSHPDIRAQLKMHRKVLTEDAAYLHLQTTNCWNPDVCSELVELTKPTTLHPSLIEVMGILGIPVIDPMADGERFSRHNAAWCCSNECLSISRMIHDVAMDSEETEMFAAEHLLYQLGYALQFWCTDGESVHKTATLHLGPDAPTFEPLAVPPVHKPTRKGQRGSKSAQHLVATHYPERLHELLANLGMPQQYTRHHASLTGPLMDILTENVTGPRGLRSASIKWVTVDAAQLLALHELATHPLFGLVALQQPDMPNLLATVDVADVASSIQQINNEHGSAKMSAFQHHTYNAHLHAMFVENVKVWTGMFSHQQV